MNKKLTTEHPELHPVPVKSPWYHLGMDFVGPISPPCFAWAKAMPTKEDMNVVSALREVSTILFTVLYHHFYPHLYI